MSHVDTITSFSETEDLSQGKVPEEPDGYRSVRFLSDVYVLFLAPVQPVSVELVHLSPGVASLA